MSAKIPVDLCHQRQFLSWHPQACNAVGKVARNNDAGSGFGIGMSTLGKSIVEVGGSLENPMAPRSNIAEGLVAEAYSLVSHTEVHHGAEMIGVAYFLEDVARFVVG